MDYFLPDYKFGDWSKFLFVKALSLLYFFGLPLFVFAQEKIPSIDDDWYLYPLCNEKSELTPFNFVKSLGGADQKGISYRVYDEEMVGDKLVVVRIEYNRNGRDASFKWYRGKKRCDVALSNTKAARQNELNKYSGSPQDTNNDPQENNTKKNPDKLSEKSSKVIEKYTPSFGDLTRPKEKLEVKSEDKKLQRERDGNNYARTIAGLIKSHTVNPQLEDIAGNPAVEFLIELLPNGMLRAELKMTKSSGLALWDQAVKRAIEKSAPFPPDPSTGKVPLQINITHSMK